MALLRDKTISALTRHDSVEDYSVWLLPAVERILVESGVRRTIGTELSHDTISNITDAVLEEVKAWQSRPLDEIYPIIYMDAIVVRVRDGHQVRNKAAHIAVGIDLDGVRHVLGIWVQAAEGAKFWAGVCAELRNRGVRDVLIVCCDGLTGFPEAIEAT